jgi:hypothetical protein
MSGVATAIAGAAVVGAVSSNIAANKQAGAANHAADLQTQQWQTTQDNLAPYMNLGNAAINPLLTAMGYNYTKNDDGTYSINGTDSSNILQQKYGNFSAPNQYEAEATPGYQFTLNQGLKATQSSAAARGLGTSGAALKGASTYATGLADSTYNDVYNRALSAYNANKDTFNTNYNVAANNVNRLQGMVSNGQNAAATTGSLGAATANSIGNTLTSGANASAAGTVGTSNALSGAMNNYANMQYVSGLMNNNAAGSSGISNYGAANSSNPSGYNVGSNSYGFTA